MRPLALFCLLLAAVAAAAEDDPLAQAQALYEQQQPKAALELLARVTGDPAAPPARRVTANVTSALCQLALSDAAGARLSLTRALALDPDLALPATIPAELAAAARADARSAVSLRLAQAAATAEAALTAAPLQANAPPSPNAPPAPGGPGPAVAEQPEPEKPVEPPPSLLGHRLGAGAHGFIVVNDKTAGPSFEVSFGFNLPGHLRLGAVATLLVGSSLAGELALRLSSTSDSTVAYLVALDVGGLYGGAQNVIAPFVTIHGAGMRIRAGLVVLELHLLSVGLYYVHNSVRFMPQAGLGILL